VRRVGPHLVDDRAFQVLDAEQRGRGAVLRIYDKVEINFFPVFRQAVIVEPGHKVPVVAYQQRKIK